MKINFNQKVFVSIIFAIFIIQFKFPALGGGTVVGNGGDPIFEFMEAARFSMIETLKILVRDSEEQKSFCQHTSLTSEQSLFCQDYFLKITPEILRLNQGSNKTVFVLRDQRLEVIGPDGKPMVAAARTLLGPVGPIELHRDSVKTLRPTQVLFLLTHEFQHKSHYNGIYVNDNDPIGPFARGRDLLDAASKSLVSLARRKGKVGTQFGMSDIFDCLVNIRNSKFLARIVTSRLFKSEDLMSYETSSGKNPYDGSISLPETNNDSLLLRFNIHEPNNCGEADSRRKTFLQIIRSQTDKVGVIHEAILAHAELPINPMCPGSDPQLVITWEAVSFSCQYYGSSSRTDN